MKLQLKNCADPDGYIEVGLKGVAAKEKAAKPKPDGMTDA